MDIATYEHDRFHFRDKMQRLKIDSNSNFQQSLLKGKLVAMKLPDGTKAAVTGSFKMFNTTKGHLALMDGDGGF